jgi:hypothetical protein
MELSEYPPIPEWHGGRIGTGMEKGQVVGGKRVIDLEV